MMKKLKEVLKRLVRRKNNSIKVNETTGEFDLSGHFHGFNNYWFPYDYRHDKRRSKISKIYDK